MASVLMEPPLFLEEVRKCWCGMQLAPIHWHLCTQAWSQGVHAVANEVKGEKTKYAHFETSHHFVLIAIESPGAFETKARIALQDRSHRPKDCISEPLPHNHLIQRISVAVQRGNTAAILETSDPGPPLAPFFPTCSLLCLIIYNLVFV